MGKNASIDGDEFMNKDMGRKRPKNNQFRSFSPHHPNPPTSLPKPPRP